MPLAHTIEDVLALATRIQNAPQEASLHELQTIAPFLKYIQKGISREAMEAIRGELIARKREHDATGCAQAFAFSGIPEDDRPWIYANLLEVALTNGCTGGCDWCGADALLVSASKVETMPYMQKFTLLDGYAQVMRSLYPEFPLGQIMPDLCLFSDTDTFDDPDIVRLISEFYEKYKAAPQLSTVVPRQGEEAFKTISHAAQKHADLRTLEEAEDHMRVTCKALKEAGIGSLSEASLGYFRFILHLILERPYATTQEEDLTGAFEKARYYASNLGRYPQGSFYPCLSLVLKTLGIEKPYTKTKIAQRLQELETSSSLKLEAPLDKIDILFPLEMAYTLRERFKQAGLALGFGELSDRYNDLGKEETLQQFEKDLARAQKERNAGELGPDASVLRVSLVKHREPVIARLCGSRLHHFILAGRSGGLKQVGTQWYFGTQTPQTGPVDNIECYSAVGISPFGVFSVVPCAVSKAYPQGTIRVPFQGRQSSGQELQEGVPLAHFLRDHIVVARSFTFDGDPQRPTPPSELRLINGKNEVFHVSFDPQTGLVTSATPVETLSDLQGLRAHRFTFRTNRKPR